LAAVAEAFPAEALEAAVAAASKMRPGSVSVEGDFVPIRKLLRGWLLSFTALVCAVLAPGLARAQAPEVIELFRSEISVAPDASVSVHETIRVRAEGSQIRHGIFRDFPTRYHGRLGNNVRVGFHVAQVLRDGQPEQYRLESIDNGMRVRIGRADFDLAPGEYTYDLYYETNRQLGFFADHDELYWNATGNGWAFPIERAEAVVRLPEGIARDTVRVEGYTGPAGAKDQNYRVQVATDGTAQFETTRSLGQHDGLTIVVSWPKGAITAPSASDQLRYFFEDNRTAFIGLAGFMVLLAYYSLVWSAVGKDPAPGPIVVRYEPPPGLSPAGMRYLQRMGFDHTTFAAAILNLAVKRCLTISHEASGYLLTRVPGVKSQTMAGLAPEERDLARQILDSTGGIALTQTNYKAVQAATKTLRESLRASEDKIYFFTNGRYIVPGLIISALALAAAMISLPGQQIVSSAFISAWLVGWSVGVFTLTMLAVTGWRKYFADGSATTMLGAVIVSLFGLPFWGGEAFGLFALIHNGSAWFAILLAALVGTNILFHYLLKAPTRAGRALLDQVEGFKRYFMAVERDPMQRVAEPEVTPEIFEKYLPYAVALGVEKAWTARFSAALAQAGKSPATYAPAWYSGTDFGSLGGAGFASAIGSALTSAVASSSSAPGSSSGGGGGGSSGGGGGGGGGGGW
jgi:uncharacterized membrane protein YgcG